MNETRKHILELVAKAEAAIPSEVLPDLPPGPYTSGASDWHGFEHQIWRLGEEIRQLLVESKSLRKDTDLQRAFSRVACNQRAKRGRQSFIMLLGYVYCMQFASDIAGQLADHHVAGHVIDTLIKMQCPSYIKDGEPFTCDKITWIRNKAKKYIEKYKISQPINPQDPRSSGR